MGEVIARIERRGYIITAMKLIQLDGDRAREHYAEHKDRPFFVDLVTFITSGPLVALAVVVLVPGAAATQATALRVVSLDRPVFSPNGNGINDTVTLHTNAAPGTLLGLRVYVWGGRLSGWKRIRTGVSSTSRRM